MAEKSHINGLGFVDGTKQGFDYENLQDDVLYFVRTTNSKENGLIYYNGKKYGNPSLDAGEYPDNTHNE